MRVDLGDRELWYEIEGEHGPWVLLFHGGPGGFDHTYFKPDFSRLSSIARVVYLDMPDHGRSDWGRPEDWTLEGAAEVMRRFCGALDIGRPIILGHSFGGLVAIEYAAASPEHLGGLILQSTFARFDLDRIVEGFRVFGGDEIAGIVRRSYEQDPTVTDEEWGRCWRLFGDWVPSAEDKARIRRNQGFNEAGGRFMLEVDLRGRLADILCPTLVSVGRLDPITPLWAAQEIIDGLAQADRSLHIIDAAGHFPWRDSPQSYWQAVEGFVSRVGS